MSNDVFWFGLEPTENCGRSSPATPRRTPDEEDKSDPPLLVLSARSLRAPTHSLRSPRPFHQQLSSTSIRFFQPTATRNKKQREIDNYRTTIRQEDG